MNPTLPPPTSNAIFYPDSDGQRMSDNTRQARWIFALYGNLSALFRDDPNVLIAADNLWYPVEGHPDIRIGPDVYVVFGRPRGDRGSYKQWLEENVPLTVAFEILSPGNTVMEMDDKLDFYDQYGVEEYYLYDPDSNRLSGFLRRGEVLRKIRPINHHVSPRLGIRFEMTEPEMTVYYPDGQPFLSFVELSEARERERQRADVAEEAHERERQRADAAEHRLTRALELSRKARRGTATPDELAELERLENASPS